MKRLMLFWHTVLKELGTWCRISTVNDWNTAVNRFVNEGEEFFTLTLPVFARDLETALRHEQVTPDLFQGFKKKAELPLFLGGFLELIFDRDTGQLHEVEATDYKKFVRLVDAIFAVRQLTLMFGKMEKECTSERKDAAIVNYLACEQEVADFEKCIISDIEDRSRYPWVYHVSSDDESVHDKVDWRDELSSFRNISKWLFGEVLTRLDGDVYYASMGSTHRHYGKLMPKHGPGKTADKLSGNRKYDLREWTRRLEEGGFPYGEYAIPNWRYYYLLDHVSFLEPGEERPVKVTLVPKTQKTPRVIAIEPTCMQYAQQALSIALAEYLEDPQYGLHDMIGFTHQSPNQAMAMMGSLDESLATLDLSEASDRVSNLLVKEMTGQWPHASEAIQASRSLTADVRGEVIKLSKFASMGSALCFPIEAMVFLTIIFYAICKETGRPMNSKLLEEFAGRVRVYGDDIIIPNEYATCVSEALELFGFKVNSHKSFWTGRFRESCGGEFYAGEDVSVTRVRRSFPERRTDVPEVISTVSLRNQFYANGLMSSVRFLDGIIGEVLPHYPKVHPDSSVVGRHTALSYDYDKVSEALQSPMVKGYVVDSRIPKSPISDEGALLKCLTKRGLLPFNDVKHLERQGRPKSVHLKLRWRQPF